MNKKLLLIAALALFGKVNAQEKRAVTDESASVINLREAVNYAQRADLLTESFENASFNAATNTLGSFTRSSGVGSTVEYKWAIASNRAAVSGNATTATFAEYLTMTNDYVIPEGSVARISADLMLNKYWLIPSGVATAGGGDFKIEITNDNGANWSTIWWEGDESLLEASFSEDFLTSSGFYAFTPRINVPAAYVGVPIKVRFSLTGTNTASVYVDNFNIYTVPSEIVSVVNVLNGDIITKYEYKRIPANQATELQVWAVARNLGFANVNRNVTVNVESPTGNFFSRSFANRPYRLGEFDTLKINTGIIPTELGVYTITTSLVDPNNADFDETFVSNFEITEDVYSHWLDDELRYIDYEDTYDVIRWGQSFEIKESTDLVGINAAFYTGTTVGGVFNAYVSIFKPNATAWRTEYEGEFTVVAGEINALTTIPLDYAVAVEAGDMVRIEVGQMAGSKIRIFATGSDNDNASTKYGPFGTGGAVNTYIGWDMTWALEAVFDNSLAIQNVKGMENVTVYPNPSTGIVNIANTVNEVLTVSVLDITGKEVATSSVFGNGSIDLSTFGAGVYIVEMSNGVSRSAQRVIVK